MSRRQLTWIISAALVASVGAAGCKKKSSGGGGGKADTITIAGSTSVQPFAEKWAEEYKGGQVDVQAGGSTAGIKAVKEGTAAIGMSSRELHEEEKAGLVTTVVARDGIAVIMHPSNPVGDLTVEQVRDIYAGKITNWKDVGGADKGITVITREEGSGTRGAFEELVMGKEAHIAASAIVQGQTGGVRTMVTGDEAAIGYISIGQLTPKVKAAKLGGVEATEANVANGTYSVKRPFLFITKGEPAGAAKAFIDYVLSAEGQELARKEGLVPAK
ncbi:MAG: phosphate ABC transporter substrate-binding protein [Deltaproteobacteria bacterium]|nr:phosphate ABC transporter substrate-binding protein [Deltaproteobacteria bacterium]